MDLCVMGKVDCMFYKNVNVVTEELQQYPVVVDVDKKKKRQNGSLMFTYVV